ncbi:hypothetical protein CLIB1423_18S01992 [[Candida] railenensis]|uniref:Uncharacterized protein n=1 Tax=[Candida] railenensis TaxID=45579 RepID=A0A9P0QUB0_9ASCO|nr:hypothetical protein CLIB1423_18S01992 [[Candida] railenensis]
MLELSIPDDYTAVVGLTRLWGSLNDLPADGTGIFILLKQANNLMGKQLPPVLRDSVLGLQLSYFGDYPDPSDLVPSIIFAIAFFIFLCAHMFIYIMNYSRGHYFNISLCAAFYCLVRTLAFSLRAAWSQDITKGRIGVAGEVFLILAPVIPVSFNLILAQRIFAWRHPVKGSSKLFWYGTFLLFGLVLVFIATNIVAGAVPVMYFLSEVVRKRYIICLQASSILIIINSLRAASLLLSTFIIRPNEKEKHLYTYQPWWIESFGIFYYVKSGEAQKAAATFSRRNSNHRHAIRVIAATHHNYSMVEGLSNQRGDLKHNHSMLIILISTVLLVAGAILRCIVMFQARIQKDTSSLGKPIAMYICYGLLEVFNNILYLVGRIDLRFYKPDRLPNDIKYMVSVQPTANQSDVEVEYFDISGERTPIDNVSSFATEKEMTDDDDNEFRF